MEAIGRSAGEGSPSPRRCASSRPTRSRSWSGSWWRRRSWRRCSRRRPPPGSGAIYLLAVLEVAIRRGELAALASALLSVLVLNYFFIAPRHRFAIAHSQDLIELVVFLIAAVVVGRLAALGRQRAAEAEERAHDAAPANGRRRCSRRRLPGSWPAAASRRSSRASATAWPRRWGPAAPGWWSSRCPSPRGQEMAVRLHRERPGMAVRVRGRRLGTGRDRPHRRAAGEADRRGCRARAGGRARGRDRGREPRRSRPNRDPARHLTRSPLSADGDHHRRLGVALGGGLGVRAPRADRRDRRSRARGWPSSSTISWICRRSRPGAVVPQADWCDLHDIVASASAHLPGRIRSSSRCRSTCRWCGPTRRSSSGCSRTCWRTRSSSRRRPRRCGSAAAPRAGRVTVRVIDRGAASRAIIAPACSSRSSADAASRLGLGTGPGDLPRLRRGQRRTDPAADRRRAGARRSRSASRSTASRQPDAPP